MTRARNWVGIELLVVAVVLTFMVGPMCTALASGISGRVEIANGHVQNHTVKLLEGSRVVATSITDAEGLFTFPEMGDGTYTLVFESYWYPTVSMTVSGNQDDVVLTIPDTGVIFAASWDDGFAADFSIVDPNPSVPVAQRITPGYVGDGAIKPELLLVYPGARELISTREGTIDLWMQLPDDDDVYYVFTAFGSGSGTYTLTGWGQFHFQFGWRKDGKYDILDSARFPLSQFRGQPVHVTMTWNVPEVRMNVYVNGVLVSTPMRRSMETGQWTEVSMDEPIPAEQLIISESLVLGTSASGTNVYPYPMDQLSIRNVELSAEEVLVDYQRKAQYRQ